MLKTKHVVLVLGLASIAVAACGSSNSTPDASGSAGTTGAAGTTGDAGTTGSAGTTGAAGTTGGGGIAACNSIGHTGPEAPEVAGVGTFPTPAGGTIVEGTYDLKEFQIFPPGSVDAYKRQETWKLAAGKIEVDSKSYDGKVTIASGTYATAGAVLTIAATCPGVMSIPLPYTATATSLWIFDNSPGNAEVHVYTKRP